MAREELVGKIRELKGLRESYVGEKILTLKKLKVVLGKISQYDRMIQQTADELAKIKEE